MAQVLQASSVNFTLIKRKRTTNNGSGISTFLMRIESIILSYAVHMNKPSFFKICSILKWILYLRQSKAKPRCSQFLPGIKRLGVSYLSLLKIYLIYTKRYSDQYLCLCFYESRDSRGIPDSLRENFQNSWRCGEKASSLGLLI